MDNGFILLSRKLLDSDVFASQKLLKIWVWCLIKASYKDRSVPLKVGKGVRIVKIKRGEFIFGRMKAEEELYIDGSTIYKSIHKLKDMDMINIKSNNQYSILSICNYDTYQQTDTYKVTTKGQPSNSEVTAEEQPSNTNKQVNKVKQVKKEEIPSFNIFSDYAKEKCKEYKLKYSESSLKQKYDAWVINDWKDGYNKQIKNWKTKLINTMKHIFDKEIKNNPYI